MEAGKQVTIDFVARGESPGEWRLVLVESGPWDDVNSALRRMQDRLYGALNAAMEGAVAEKFPESNGLRMIIQVDCYDAPESEVTSFFERFSAGVLLQPHYQEILRDNRFVSGVSFKVEFDTTEGL